MITVDTAVTLMTFGKWLKTKRTEARMSGGDLERRSGVSRQYISNLERGQKQEKSQKPIQPTIEVVDKLAKALGADIDEARLAAGYAPKTIVKPPRNRAELIAALERLGVGQIEFFNGGVEDASPEQLQEVYEAIRLVVEVTLRKQGSK